MRKISATLFTLLLLASTYSSASAVRGPATPAPVQPSVSAVAPGTIVAPASEATSPAGTTIDEDFNPIVTLVEGREHGGWRSYDRFDISNVDGLQDTYDSNAKIDFAIEGRSAQADVEANNGFDVVVTLFDLTRNVGKRAEVEFDPQKHVWQASLTAPKESGNEFKLVINLFCKKKNATCATTYGFGTQVDKIQTLQVR